MIENEPLFTASFRKPEKVNQIHFKFSIEQSHRLPIEVFTLIYTTVISQSSCKIALYCEPFLKGEETATPYKKSSKYDAGLMINEDVFY